MNQIINLNQDLRTPNPQKNKIKLTEYQLVAT